MRFAAGAWWSTVLRDVIDEADEELVVFLEISSLAVFAGAVALAQELGASGAAAIALRILDARGVTIAFDRDDSTLTLRGERGTGLPGTSIPMRQRPTLFFDGRAFAARRAALAAVGVRRAPQLEDDLGDVDWCWRSGSPGSAVTSATTSVAECEHPVGRETSAGAHAPGRAHVALRVLAEVLGRRPCARVRALHVGRRRCGGATQALVGRDPGACHAAEPGADARRAGASRGATRGRGRRRVGADRDIIQRGRVLTDDQLFAEVGTIFGSSAIATPEGGGDPRSSPAPAAAMY